MRPRFQILAAIAFLLLACSCLYFGVSGILDGVVKFPRKRLPFQLIPASSHLSYWASIAFWLAGAVALGWLAAANFLKTFRRA